MKAQIAQKLEWSDIPFILAVCNAGSLAGAARVLGVNHSTVFRRVENVEAKLGVRLFERRSHGYVMTAAGEVFFKHARALNDGMHEIELELSGQDLRLAGDLVVTTTNSLLHCLSPVFAAFQKAHPAVEMRILTDPRALDLMQREADIALRPTKSPPDRWVGRKLCPVSFATYARTGYVGDPMHWIVLNSDYDQSAMNQITRRVKAAEATVTVANTMMGVFDLVRAGLGVAAMPSYLGEKCPDFSRVHDPDPADTWDLWVLAHPDVRRSARVHAFFGFAAAHITKETLNSSDVYTTR